MAGRKPSHGARISAATAVAYAALALPWLVGADLVLGFGAGFRFLSGREMALYTACKGAVFIAVSGVALHHALRRRDAARDRAASRLRIITEAAPVGIAWTDAAGAIRHANPIFRHLFGLAPGTVEGARLDALLPARHDGIDGTNLLPDSGTRRTTLHLRDGERESDIALTSTRAGPGDPDPGWVLTALDITEGREAAERLERLAYLDALTHLPNRTRFTETLAALLSAPDSGRIVVAQIDIRKFHEVNASAGDEVGDALLVAVARRLTDAFPQALIGRLSGDEFALALPVAGDSAPEDLVERIHAELGERFVLPGISVDAFFAIGFTVADSGTSAMAAIRQAGVAVSDAKKAGFGETRRFDQEAEASIRGRVRLTSEMQQAMANGEFLLQYQPKVHLASGAIVGAEALIRWRHPIFGLQPPSRFLPAAEQTGLILDLGEWALQRAARFAATLNADRTMPLSLSINISRVHFRRRDLARTLQGIVIETGIDPSWLTLELTESIVAGPTAEMLEALRRLRDLGFGLSIDDFGTGASSMQHLGTFPLSEIKLDRSFVAGIEEKEYNRAVLAAVLTLSAALGVSVTAEGIETRSERTALLEMGCTFGHGYFYSPPLDEHDFADLVRLHRVLPPHAAGPWAGRDVA